MTRHHLCGREMVEGAEGFRLLHPQDLGDGEDRTQEGETARQDHGGSRGHFTSKHLLKDGYRIG